MEKRTPLHKKYPILYRAWSHMKTRCYNKKSPRYKNYGGRGIGVCYQWQKGLDIQLCIYDESYRGTSKKKVICLDTNVVYDSIISAGEILNINSNNLGQVCLGKRKTVGGLKFEYYYG